LKELSGSIGEPRKIEVREDAIQFKQREFWPKTMKYISME
jgi:hypothetical protein